MKKHYLLWLSICGIFLFAGNMSATPQNDEPVSEILFNGESYNFIFQWKDNNKKKKKYMRPNWTGIGFSFISYDDKDIPYSSYKGSKSYNISLNLASRSIYTSSDNWMLYTGLGMDWSRIHFDGNELTQINGITQFHPAPEGTHYKSSKLLAYYFTIPLMLEYQPKRKIHISTGVVGLLKYYSKSQVKYYDEYGKKRVENRGRDLNMRVFDYKFRIQAGISGWRLFADLGPSYMFRKHKGPALSTHRWGISMGF